MIASMVQALTIGLADAVHVGVTRSRGGQARSPHQVVSRDTIEELIEALRYRKAQVAELLAENTRLNAMVDAQAHQLQCAELLLQRHEL